MLATQILLLWTLIIVLVIVIRERRAKAHLADFLAGHQADLMHHKAKIGDHDQNLEVLRTSYHELFKLLKTSVSIDVGGRHDCGWLIFIAKINGKDAVRIQHLKPNMSMKEYKDLVTKLSYDCQHVAYIDGPMHMEEFLRPVGSDPLQRNKRRF